jgi:hypothetical protein
MSEIISFRLSNDNPREAHALELLNSKHNQGYSIRFIITEALLMLENQGMGSEYQFLMIELRNILREVNNLQTEIENERCSPIKHPSKVSGAFDLSDNLITGIKSVVKPGLKIE